MNYEKIILDLYERVVTLEEKVRILDNKLASQNIPFKDETLVNPSEKITRNVSRKYVMDQLKAENPNFSITKGNRTAKADILLKTTENEINYTLKAKFYHSKSFNDFPSGWHTLHVDDLVNEDIHLFIFNVEFEKNFYPFLFSKQDLLSFVKDKATDQNNLYHFYFHIKQNKVLEVRDQEKDASIYYNNWRLPSVVLKK